MVRFIPVSNQTPVPVWMKSPSLWQERPPDRMSIRKLEESLVEIIVLQRQHLME